MDANIDNLKFLLDRLKNMGLFSRVFAWRSVRRLLMDAAGDLQKLISINQYQMELIVKLENERSGLQKDIQVAKETSMNLQSEARMLALKNDDLLLENKNHAEMAAAQMQAVSDLTRRKFEIELDLTETKRDLHNRQNETLEIKKQNTELLKDEEFRKIGHSNAIAALTRIQDQIQNERSRELEEKNNSELNRILGLRETWTNHQENVQQLIRGICSRHNIVYVDKVPFKGDPDNTLLICDEHIVFDAKSPAGEDLNNFPAYLKDQAEKAKKYAQQENVKSDIFFVVPSHALPYLAGFIYRHGDHNVFIISHDALEPIIVGLKKIEQYEFAEQLSPDDRENICRVLGRFAHLSKRRIQVDSFFAKQFIELAYKCETDLPADMLESVMEFERAEKLNPPQEKRAKAISIAEIEKENRKIKQEADGRGIIIDEQVMAETLKNLPLYK